ncbi:MAG: hypothetical protein AAGI01_09450, partial [Myxococcota bacterium]
LDKTRVTKNNRAVATTASFEQLERLGIDTQEQGASHKTPSPRPTMLQRVLLLLVLLAITCTAPSCAQHGTRDCQALEADQCTIAQDCHLVDVVNAVAYVNEYACVDERPQLCVRREVVGPLLGALEDPRASSVRVSPDGRCFSFPGNSVLFDGHLVPDIDCEPSMFEDVSSCNARPCHELTPDECMQNMHYCLPIYAQSVRFVDTCIARSENVLGCMPWPTECDELSPGYVSVHSECFFVSYSSCLDEDVLAAQNIGSGCPQTPQREIGICGSRESD